ncbi:MAG: hypothetical protein PHU56_00785 [Candidatus Pacebacteria bacterium]|nr:hypothetical protein [Candidatus Paceibacterota bacterium]
MNINAKGRIVSPKGEPASHPFRGIALENPARPGLTGAVTRPYQKVGNH